MSELRILIELIGREARWKLATVFVLSCLAAPAEVAGIGAIVAFLSVVAEPSITTDNAYLQVVYKSGGFESFTSFVSALGVCMVLAVTLSNLLQAAVSYVTMKLTWDQHQVLSLDLMQTYLSREYLWFLSQNTSDLGKTVLGEVSEITAGMLRPVLGLGANVIRVVGVSLFLLAVDLKIFICALFSVMTVFTGLVWFTRIKLSELGKKRLLAGRATFRGANEMLAGIKEVKLLGVGDFLIGRFKDSISKYADAEVEKGVITLIPRYALQTLALSGVGVLAIFLTRSGPQDSAIFTTLAIFTIGGYRLMNACQRVYSNYSAVKFGSASLESIRQDLANKPTNSGVPRKPLTLCKHIEFCDVSFAYPGQQAPVLDRLSLKIACGSKVAFVGSTGAGKTTLINLVLCLLEPGSGHIKVDDDELTKDHAPAWHSAIGYVPQEIFLIDDTILRNIAFGIADNEIDEDAVKAAARIAQIDEFINKDLEEGYNTRVGERGVRLSGGQRQRVGLARALYRNPQVLVLDEATSALDSATEAAVIRELDASGPGKTVIFVAHRFKTVERCDVIYVLRKGGLVDSGTYSELMERCEEFRRLAGSAGTRTTCNVT